MNLQFGGGGGLWAEQLLQRSPTKICLLCDMSQPGGSFKESEHQLMNCLGLVRLCKEGRGSACLLCAIIPPQQAQVIDHGLWEVALRPELSH